MFARLTRGAHFAALTAVFAVLAALACSGAALADDGDIIDRCWLDGNDALHCSTPNRRGAEAEKLVLDSVLGFDLDQRMQYLAAVASAWQKHQKGRCRSATIDVNHVFSAYNGPGRSYGDDIKDLPDACERDFSNWLFRQENHGKPPGPLAYVSTLVVQETATARKAMRQCPKEAKALIKALQAWLSAVKKSARAQGEGPTATPQSASQLAATNAAGEASNAKEAATKNLNACLNGEPEGPETADAPSVDADRVAVAFAGLPPAGQAPPAGQPQQQAQETPCDRARADIDGYIRQFVERCVEQAGGRECNPQTRIDRLCFLGEPLSMRWGKMTDARCPDSDGRLAVEGYAQRYAAVSAACQSVAP